MIRTNTRKLYETHHKVKLAKGVDVHHILPVRLGGTHEVENLIALDRVAHANAHLALFEKYGDAKDKCAYFMLLGRTQEAAALAASLGGRAAEESRKKTGRLTGFQLMSPERREEIASVAGRTGGTAQKERGLGIHTKDQEQRRAWARKGGIATIELLGLNDSARQAERGRKGGAGNKGFLWYHTGAASKKYTALEQEAESFEDFIKRTGYKKGRRPNEDQSDQGHGA